MSIVPKFTFLRALDAGGIHIDFMEALPDHRGRYGVALGGSAEDTVRLLQSQGRLCERQWDGEYQASRALRAGNISAAVGEYVAAARALNQLHWERLARDTSDEAWDEIWKNNYCVVAVRNACADRAPDTNWDAELGELDRLAALPGERGEIYAALRERLREQGISDEERISASHDRVMRLVEGSVARSAAEA